MNIVTVRINGVEYNLKGDEREEYLHKVAGYVDKKVRELIESNPKLSTSSASILTAINTVDEYLKKQEEVHEAFEIVKKKEEQEKNYKQEIDILKQKILQLEAYVEELTVVLEEPKYKEQLEVKEKELEVTVKEIENITKEREVLQETCKKYMEENNILKAECKEYKFQVQSHKYKTIDLQNRLIEAQVELAKAKRQSYPFVSKEVTIKK
ncbi:cell division protein ZapA [Clostridium pascui]|uniref:cell division protein ZapA n=1 Tax=Clostridium pascui TaxID=46609 RepID=UPI00195BED74|nr:cell division protein ZapA [Clostridium pascui]MBM7870073.1 cell division protein ZapA [Clostridium pascui]